MRGKSSCHQNLLEGSSHAVFATPPPLTPPNTSHCFRSDCYRLRTILHYGDRRWWRRGQTYTTQETLYDFFLDTVRSLRSSCLLFGDSTSLDFPLFLLRNKKNTSCMPDGDSLRNELIISGDVLFETVNYYIVQFAVNCT